MANKMTLKIGNDYLMPYLFLEQELPIRTSFWDRQLKVINEQNKQHLLHQAVSEYLFYRKKRDHLTDLSNNIQNNIVKKSVSETAKKIANLVGNLKWTLDKLAKECLETSVLSTASSFVGYYTYYVIGKGVATYLEEAIARHAPPFISTTEKNFDAITLFCRAKDYFLQTESFILDIPRSETESILNKLNTAPFSLTRDESTIETLQNYIKHVEDTLYNKLSYEEKELAHHFFLEVAPDQSNENAIPRYLKVELYTHLRKIKHIDDLPELSDPFLNDLKDKMKTAISK